MVTAEELTVAIRSEGVSETQQDLEGVESSMQDTADSAGTAADDLEGFSQRFKGAMSAAVAALAVAAAGLLSQVPVIGEVGSGLGAVLDSLILKIDGALRPSLSGLRDDLFDVANEINKTNNVFDAFAVAIDGVNQSVDNVAINALQSEIRSITGVTIPRNWLDLGWDIITLDTRQAVEGLKQVVREFPEDFGILLGSISPQARKQYDRVLADTREFINALISNVKAFPSAARDVFSDVASELSQWASDQASDAKQWGRNLIEGFISGIRSVIGKVRQWLSDLRDIGGSIGVDVPSLGDISGTITGGGGGGGGRLFGGFSSGGGGQIDGRQLTESTGRYRSDPNRRRGL